MDMQEGNTKINRIDRELLSDSELVEAFLFSKLTKQGIENW
jgi:hypothetical protein